MKRLLVRITLLVVMCVAVASCKTKSHSVKQESRIFSSQLATYDTLTYLINGTLFPQYIYPTFIDDSGDVRVCRRQAKAAASSRPSPSSSPDKPLIPVAQIIRTTAATAQHQDTTSINNQKSSSSTPSLTPIRDDDQFRKTIYRDIIIAAIIILAIIYARKILERK